jgi:hypothetical protein
VVEGVAQEQMALTEAVEVEVGVVVTQHIAVVPVHKDITAVLELIILILLVLRVAEAEPGP